MKKFIATIPPFKGQRDGIYIAVNNDRLKSNIKTHFPVLPLIKGYCDPGEQIEIIITYVNDEVSPESKNNFEEFKIHAEKYLEDIDYKINEIAVKYDESVEAHLNTFTRIIEQIKEGDELFADITFGKKPVPIIQIMALNYALRAMKDVRVECLSYGDSNFSTHKLEIYDVTSLLYMDEIINNISKNNVENPIDVIKSILE